VELADPVALADPAPLVEAALEVAVDAAEVGVAEAGAAEVAAVPAVVAAEFAAVSVVLAAEPAALPAPPPPGLSSPMSVCSRLTNRAPIGSLPRPLALCAAAFSRS
jgi:hypothetical protein